MEELVKCRKQPQFLEKRPVKIANLIEVHLSVKQWARIVEIAAHRGKTFSLITRYCVLRLARKENLRWTPIAMRAHTKMKKEKQLVNEFHRHVVCLYGEDEMLIRLAALRLKITMSAFIRLSLQLFLNRLAMENHSYRFITDETLKWQAIRFIEKSTTRTQNQLERPSSHRLKWFTFALSSFW
ncbi:MAG TPA: hypothetical protein PLY93_05420 [Turneriella sp.]|nr:hypothetical protein [Turneriella sp.]